MNKGSISHSSGLNVYFLVTLQRLLSLQLYLWFHLVDLMVNSTQAVANADIFFPKQVSDMSWQGYSHVVQNQDVKSYMGINDPRMFAWGFKSN